MSELRYATVRKYATRELTNNNCQHAIIGAKIVQKDGQDVLVLASNPDKIVYIVDDVSFENYIQMLFDKYPQINSICAVHR